MILESCARKISVTTDIGTLGPQEKARNLQIQNAGASYKIIILFYNPVWCSLRRSQTEFCLYYLFETCVCLTFRTRTSDNYSYSFHIQNFLFLLQIPDTQAQACLRTYVQQSYTKSNYQISTWTQDPSYKLYSLVSTKGTGDRFSREWVLMDQGRYRRRQERNSSGFMPLSRKSFKILCCLIEVVYMLEHLCCKVANSFFHLFLLSLNS